MTETDLQIIEDRFHDLIIERAGILDWVKQNTDKLPRITAELLKPISEDDERYDGGEKYVRWFRVPGMYGGFAYELRIVDGEYVLTVESWYRIIGGSGQRHRITVDDCELLEEGFV